MPDLGLEGFIPYFLYGATILIFLLSVFWRPIAGICFLVPLIPLQTIRYRIIDFPLGQSMIGIILLGVALGLLRRRQWILPRTPWTALLGLYGLYTFMSLFLGSNDLGPRLGEWRDYMMMPLLFFLVVGTVKKTSEMKLIVLLMCLAILTLDKTFWNTVSGRDYSTFSTDLQEGGAMGYSGVQGLAAFNAQSAWFLVALAGTQQKRLMRLACMGLAMFAAVCVMYSFSRGGYVALLAGWLFIGLVKYRKLLILLVLFGLTWTSLVPNAVQERVLMTYDTNDGALDHSAELRLELWTDAMELFKSNPLLGTGFDSYAYMRRVHNYADTHNIYLKVLVETGVIGLGLFLWLLAKTYRTGYWLFSHTQEPFFSGLGLGLAAWIVCTATASMFGDRWTHFQISGYMWVLAGLVARSIAIQSSNTIPQPLSAGPLNEGSFAAADRLAPAV